MYMLMMCVFLIIWCLIHIYTYVHFMLCTFYATYIYVHRDIPMPLVTSGVEHGNLRELALARMNDLGTKVSQCIYVHILYFCLY